MFPPLWNEVIQRRSPPRSDLQPFAGTSLRAVLLLECATENYRDLPFSVAVVLNALSEMPGLTN